MKNRGLGPLWPPILDPIYVICAFGSMLSCILCERQKFSESHKLKRFGAWNQFRAARFVTVLIITRSMNAMEWVFRNTSVGGIGTTKSRDMTLDWWLLTSSGMSVLQAVMANTTLKMTKSNYAKSWSGTTRTINLDPIYVIYAFGSMLPCILCERQKCSESHKLKRFGAQNQFRAARFVTVLFIGCSLNAMELVFQN